MLTTKKCTKCKTTKPISKFTKRKDSYYSWCIKCTSDRRKIYQRTPQGLIYEIHNTQKKTSRKRGHELPLYTKEEFYDFIINQDNFEELYDNWVNHNYIKELRPSVDRISDFKPYTLGNIQLMTWEENSHKSCQDRRNGIDNRATKSVSQYDLDGNFIKEYHSTRYASRCTGISSTTIVATCKDKQKQSGGFIWKYS